MYRTPLSLFTGDCDLLLDQASFPQCVQSLDTLDVQSTSLGTSSSEQFVEFAYYYPMTNALDISDTVLPGQCFVVKMDRSRTVTRQVVVKEDDLLTPEQVRNQYPEVQKAMLKELKTWAELKCFSRRPRKFAKNIIDVRLVHKRKWEKPKTDGKQEKKSASVGTEGGDHAGHWTIRSRLIVRGFKDAQK